MKARKQEKRWSLTTKQQRKEASKLIKCIREQQSRLMAENLMKGNVTLVKVNQMLAYFIKKQVINCKKFVPRSIICRDYSKCDPESLCIDIENSNVNLTDQLENVNKAWSYFCAT